MNSRTATLVAPAHVDCIDPTQDPAWASLLRHPLAGVFHSPPWLSAVADTYGFAVRAYIASDDTGSPLGGVLFSEINDLSGCRVVSLPFTDNCDPLVSSPEIWRLLLARLQSHNVPLHLRCFQDHVATLDGALTVAKRARWHFLSLEQSPDSLWSGLAGSTRRAIRKAEQASIEVRPLVSSEECAEFVRLHVTLRKQKYRLFAQPPSFFAALAHHFKKVDGWFPLGAFLNGRFIAGVIYLRWGDTLYYKFNASALDALEVRPNNLLVWAGISLGRSLGCHTLDLGPSDDDQPGLIRFKRNFGSEVRELQFLRWNPQNWEGDRGPEVRRHLGDLTYLLTAPNVPDEVAARAGALLYRLFA